MKNKILIGSIIAIIVIIIAAIGVSMVLDEKGKFIGTWEYLGGGIITFYQDDTAIITEIGPLKEFELNGDFNYFIENHHITFSSPSGDISITFNYNFPDSNTLELSTNNGFLITLTNQ